ncbi:MAG: 30S ribosomal protein S9 [Anaerolineae bacterium]
MAMNLPGQYHYAVGRRKAATAEVRLYPGGTGTILVNNKTIIEYFGSGNERYIEEALAPLRATGNDGRFNVTVLTRGGGVHGQAGAIRLGIARALDKANPDMHSALKTNGLLTRDPREKERKKPGLRRARKRPQYTKR